MRSLITGITGFVGGYLAELLVDRSGEEVFGLSRRGRWPAELAHLSERAGLRACDLADAGAIEGLLRDIEPERIFHLAGYAHAGQSLREPQAAWAGNLEATRNLYDAVARWGGRTRIVYVGSGLVYGGSPSAETSFAEDAPLRPASPYATSKAAADLLSYQYTQTSGLDIVRARPFNHTGPRQPADYAVPNFARQIAAIERGEQLPVLETGNLTACRDMTDVRDVVEAYRLLAELGQTGDVYNIASGRAVAMQTMLERLLAAARVQVEVRARAGLLRAHDARFVQGDAGHLRRITGWQPRYTLDQTLAELLDYWRRSPATERH